jgi:hypothetical protein
MITVGRLGMIGMIAHSMITRDIIPHGIADPKRGSFGPLQRTSGGLGLAGAGTPQLPILHAVTPVRAYL